MILAGIDEAGYGPLLGPLVVGCCAFQVDGEGTSEQLPCLWKRLHKIVSKTRLRRSTKLHINDSKLVYSPSRGIKELERSILAVLAAGFQLPSNLHGLLCQLAPHALDDLRTYSWYQPGDHERFPIAQDAAAISLFANALRVEMNQCGARCVHLAARVVLERQLNHLIGTTRNKGSALFCTAAIHLDHLLSTYGGQDLVIFCDQQGGRQHYGSLLRLMFPDWSLAILREENGPSEYELRYGKDTARIIFCEKAETQCMSVALASMLSKYLREALMHRFNAFWKRHLPDLMPTAGYYTDGLRFLRDIDEKRRQLGIDESQLIRSR